MNEEQLQPKASEVQYINKVVAIILSTGMYLTTAFYAVGLILVLAKGDGVPHLSQQYFYSVASFLMGIVRLDPRAYLYLGTICLIMTPVSRVFISIFAFWKEKYFKYVAVTAVVFLVIVASVIIGSVFKINVG